MANNAYERIDDISVEVPLDGSNRENRILVKKVSGRRFSKKLWLGVYAFAGVSLFGLLSASGFSLSRSNSGPLGKAEEECELGYGFLPCSTNLGGNIFLMVVYGYLLLVAAQLISEGSEMLLQVLNPGIIGGLLLPVLGAFPDALLIAVSGIGGTAQEAQEQVLVGMGVLAGSTIMILTIAWGGALIFGRCDLSGPNGTAKDRTLTRGFNLFETGVTTDDQTRSGALIMLVSVLPFLVLQIPLIDGHEASEGSTAALVGLILAFGGLVAYCAYQVASPWLQEVKIENARLHLIRTVALSQLHKMADTKSWGGLVLEDGSPNTQTLSRIFLHFDENKDGTLQESELKALIFGIGLQQGSIPADAQVKTWLDEFDKDASGGINEEEFVKGMSTWVNKLSANSKASKIEETAEKAKTALASYLGQSAAEAKKAVELIEEAEQDEEDAEEDAVPLTAGQIYRKAILLMLIGAAVVAVFADPMVDAISNFSTASKIPAFFVAFVVTPIASNASELVSSLLFAMKRRKRTISLTYCQVYGAITMNNTLCLGVFLAIVYLRGLAWEFSSEVTIILLATGIVGFVGSRANTFKLASAFGVLLLYPLSLGLVAFLDTVLGWQ